MSPALERLLQQMADHTGVSWQSEAYDLVAAEKLDSAERAEFVEKLIHAAKQGDTFSIMTLGYMNATEAVPMLEAEAATDQPWAGTARRALVLLGKGADVLAEIAHDAVNAPNKMTRVAAIMDLQKLGGPTAIFALLQSLGDGDSDVRVLAWDALIDCLGIARRLEGPDGARDLTTELEVMRVLLASELPALARIGATGVREVARRLAGGATPQQLGIAWRPRTSEDTFDKLRSAIFSDPPDPYPVAELKTLKGVERLLAETMIARRVEAGDERAPDALVAVGAAWTAPALAEIARYEGTPPTMKAKLEAAAGALSSN